MNRRYFVAQCTACGQWNNTWTSNIHTHSFKCYICNKSTRLKINRYFGLSCNAHECSDLTQSAELVRKLNKGRGISSDASQDTSSFHSYKRK